MTIGVVEAFELIQIQEHQRQRLCVAPRPTKLTFKRTVKLPSIGNACECVDGDESTQTLVRGLAGEGQLAERTVACFGGLYLLTQLLFEFGLRSFELEL